MRETILKYLGYKNYSADEETDKLIDEMLIEVKELANFKYIYKKIEKIDFLNGEGYREFLDGIDEIYLVGMTLGNQIDKRIKYYSNISPSKMMVFDACSSAYLEYMSDEYEKIFGENRTFRFCPGYGKASIKDNLYIHSYLDAFKNLNITILDSYLMVPQKSMLGIIGIGKKKKRTCDNCLDACPFKMEGKTCYKE